jgi:hypothetical protein
VLAIGLVVLQFKSGRERWIFKGDKNPYHDFLLGGGEVNPSVSFGKILRQVKDPLIYDRGTAREISAKISRPVSPHFATRCVC